MQTRLAASTGTLSAEPNFRALLAKCFIIQTRKGHLRLQAIHTFTELSANGFPQQYYRRKTKGHAMDKIENKKLLIWDKEAMFERFLGDEHLVKEILTCFLQDLPIRMEGLKRGLNAKDMATAALHAHSVRGAAANMGADILQHLAKEMELSCNNNDMKNLSRNIKLLEEAINDFIKELSMHGKLLAFDEQC